MFGTNGLEKSNLTVANIYSRLDDRQLLDYYFPTYKLNSAISSPFRRDRKPSFSFYVNGDGRIGYKDFSTGESGDVLNLIQKLKGLTFRQTLETINRDFNLKFTFDIEGIKSTGIAITNEVKALMYLGIEKPKETKIEVSIRDWNGAVDKQYWSKYGITGRTLQSYNVFPLQAFYIDDNYVQESKTNPIYGYYFGEGKWKIYQPYSLKYKWISNVNKRIIQGVNQVQQTGELMIVTKALKDVMCYRELGYDAIAPQSESTMIDLSKFDYTHFIINFDFDYTGVIYGNKYTKLYDKKIDCCYFTNGRFGTINYGAKDISDFIALKGMKEAELLVKSVLNDLKIN